MKTILQSLLIIAGLSLMIITKSECQTIKNNNHDMNTNKENTSKFEFPTLPYSYDALEPYIDKTTMEIHYSKHHRAYYDNFMKAIAGTEAENMCIKDIFANISKYPVAVRNNGGGYYNHKLFWENMAPKGENGEISTELKEAIIKRFGSLEEFEKLFEEAAKTRFGSGWAWLILDENKDLQVVSTPNQDNPLMDIADKKGTPLLALDVWEHAYYLKYQNRRPDYVNAFWNVVNWTVVSSRFEKTMQK